MKYLLSLILLQIGLVSLGQSDLIYFNQDVYGHVSINHYNGKPLMYSDFFLNAKCSGKSVNIKEMTIDQDSVESELRSYKECISKYNATNFTLQNPDQILWSYNPKDKQNRSSYRAIGDLKIRYDEVDEGDVCSNGGHYVIYYYSDLTFNEDSTIKSIISGETNYEDDAIEIPNMESYYTYQNGRISEVNYKKVYKGKSEDYATQYHIYDKKNRLTAVCCYEYPENISVKDSLEHWQDLIETGKQNTNRNMKRLVIYTYGKHGLTMVQTLGENRYHHSAGYIHYTKKGLIDTFQQTNSSGDYGLELVYTYSKKKRLIGKRENRGYGCKGSCGSLIFVEEYLYNKSGKMSAVIYDYLDDRLPKWTRLKLYYKKQKNR